MRGLPSIQARALTPAGPAVAAPIPAEGENLTVRETRETPVQGALEQRALFNTALSASVANGPNGALLKSSAVPDVQVVASSKEKVASIAWSVDISGQPRPGILSADQLTLTASGKLDDSGEARIIGLRGFENGTEVKLGFTHYGSRVRLSGVEKPEVDAARKACRDTPGATPAACDPYAYATGVGAFVDKYNPTGLRSLLDTVLPGPVLFYGVEFSGNQSRFKYLDRPSFTLKKADRFGFSAAAFGGLLLGDGQTSIGGAFTYKREDEEQDPVTLCQAVALTTFTQCITAADGRPNHGTAAIFSADLRHAFRLGQDGSGSLAFAPEVSLDIDNHAWSLDLPVYFAPDAESGKLRGGIRGLYVNERDLLKGGRTDDFTLSLFVGVPFSLFRD